MSEKRRPTHKLSAFKEICGDPNRLTVTQAALKSAQALGFGREEIATAIRALEPRHFYKSMTSYANPRQWQDVYHAPSPAGLIYVKFTDDVVSQFILLSFKEKDDE